MRNRLLRQLKRYFFRSNVITFSSQSSSVSRRDFLKRSVQALALSSFVLSSSAFSKGQSSQVISTNQKPIVIVGAGLGGLTAAYALMKRGIRCELFESSERLGGRVFTHSNFNQSNQFCEMGGELIDSNHLDLINLAQELNVPLERLNANDGQLASELYWINGTFYDEADVINAFTPLAQVIKNDLKTIFLEEEPYCFMAGQVPTHYLLLDQMSLAQYLEKIAPELDDWFIKMLEAAYVSEFGLPLEQQSALNLLMTIGVDTTDSFELYGESDEAWRIKGGNSQLVKALVQKLAKTVPIHTGTQLKKLTDSGQAIQLYFSKQGSSSKTVLTDVMVLAIPFSVLRSVEGIASLGLNPNKLNTIQNLGYGTNGKLMMNFKTRFWRDPELVNSPHAGEIYTDLPSQNLWETSRSQSGLNGIITNFCGGERGKGLSKESFEATRTDLESLYGKNLIQSQLLPEFKLMNWSKYPHSQGSYSCFKPGQYSQMYGLMGQPELGGRVLFVGEHAAWNFPGFMCGAVESGLTAAQQIIQ